MAQTIDLEKKRQAVRDLLDEVRTHEMQFREPCPSKILAAKFGKRVQPFGGYRAFIYELERDGAIELMRVRTGGVFISIPNLLDPEDL